MSIFEFVMVLASIVIGLGISGLLTGLGELLRHRNRAQVYWLQLVQSLLQMVLFITVWWTGWSFNEHDNWSVGLVLLLMTAYTFFFLAGHLVFPREGNAVDYRAYYYAQHRPFYTLLLSGFATVVVMSSWVLGSPLANQAGNLVALLPLVILAASKSPRVHEILLPIFTSLLILGAVLTAT